MLINTPEVVDAESARDSGRKPEGRAVHSSAEFRSVILLTATKPVVTGSTSETLTPEATEDRNPGCDASQAGISVALALDATTETLKSTRTSGVHTVDPAV